MDLLQVSSCCKKLLPIVTLLLLLVASQLVAAFLIKFKTPPGEEDWNYSNQVRWNQMHHDCAGRAQSPIDIQHKNVIISQHLKLQFYNYANPLKFKLSNAHHTIKMDPTGTPAYPDLQQEIERHGVSSGTNLNGSSIHDIITADEYVEFADTQAENVTQRQNERLVSLPIEAQQHNRLNANKPQANNANRRVSTPPSQDINNHNNNNYNNFQRGSHAGDPYGGAPTIKLDWLDDGNNEYKLRDIHFHWGERRDNGSEHAIDGRRAAMEMHLVHIKHGLDKSKIGFTSDSLAVIAILIESHRKSNADFNPIVNELARINSTESAQLIDYKSIYDLLPSQLDAFYTYSGSLTTPPCYQVVNWIVMAERLNMNAKQIEMFRNLYAPPKEEDDDEEGVDDASRQVKAKQKLAGSNSYVQSLGELQSASNIDDSSIQTHGTPIEHHEQVEPIMPNVRSIQPLNNRTILASFTKQGSRLKAALNSAGGSSTYKSFQNMWLLLITTLMTSALATHYTNTDTTTITMNARRIR